MEAFFVSPTLWQGPPEIRYFAFISLDFLNPCVSKQCPTEGVWGIWQGSASKHGLVDTVYPLKVCSCTPQVDVLTTFDVSDKEQRSRNRAIKPCFYQKTTWATFSTISGASPQKFGESAMKACLCNVPPWVWNNFRHFPQKRQMEPSGLVFAKSRQLQPHFGPILTLPPRNKGKFSHQTLFLWGPETEGGPLEPSKVVFRVSWKQRVHGHSIFSIANFQRKKNTTAKKLSRCVFSCFRDTKKNFSHRMLSFCATPDRK